MQRYIYEVITLSNFVLKILALLIMIVDHTAFMFYDRIPHYATLRLIGRIAFPLYAFLIAEGCFRTKDIRNYLSRLLILSLISEIPYDLFIYQERFWSAISTFSFFPLFQAQNVFFTHAFGVLSVIIYQGRQKRGDVITMLLLVSTLICSYLLQGDYAPIGVALIFCLYILMRRANHRSINKRDLMLFVSHTHHPVPIFAVVPLLLAGYFLYGFTSKFLFYSIAIPLIFLYNGEKGPKFQWFFYYAYPFHLFAIAFARWYFSH